MSETSSPLSIRRQLLLGILLPVVLLLSGAAFLTYKKTLEAVTVAYDRTLLASAKAIGEQISISETQSPPILQANLPYASLEAFEADNRSKLFYQIRDFNGRVISGYHDLPQFIGKFPQQNVYAALVHFYDDSYNGEPVRIAVLQQPVSGQRTYGMATVQVAETLELRRALARRILFDNLIFQGFIVLLIAGVAIAVVNRTTLPLRQAGQAIAQRDEQDLAPLSTKTVPREVLPLIEANNLFMARLSRLMDNQKRFVRDTAHQIRTPLAVLKTQVQSARRGDLPAAIALADIEQTVDRATLLANQMLDLAKVEQLRLRPNNSPQAVDKITREVALELAPLIAEKQLQLNLDLRSAQVLAHRWMIQELVRNLLHNAIRHSPVQGELNVSFAPIQRPSSDPVTRASSNGASVEPEMGQMIDTDCDWLLTIEDQGPGISARDRERLFQPFSSPTERVNETGSGLGLVICDSICKALGAEIELENRDPGLCARVVFHKA